MSRFRTPLALAAIAAALAPAAQAQPTIIAHRGPHQDFRTEGLTNETCTAARMLAPTHGYLENTIPSIRRAFELGADVVEFDIHPTADGEFAVFHDWTLECRTDGRGVTREHTMAQLKRLDIGHGYTADEGRSFPFRGKGRGLMPTFAEVVRAFPGRRFLVNIKSNDPREAELIDRYLTAKKLDAAKLAFFGGEKPIVRLRELRPKVRATYRQEAQACMMKTLAAPADAPVADECRKAGQLGVPLNLTAAFKGWPNGLLERMRAAGVEVTVVGPVDMRNPVLAGVDTLEDLAKLPKDFRGAVVTDRIEVIGPALKPPR